MLDLCNAAFALDPRHGQEVVDTYLSNVGARMSREQLATLRAAWFARRLGAEFVAGNLLNAGTLVAAYRQGDRLLPADFSGKGADVAAQHQAPLTQISTSNQQ